MKILATIRLKPGVLDAEASEIERALKSGGHGDVVAGVAQARVIELDLAIDDEAAALEAARAMCERLLANPVIETYSVEPAR